MERYIVIYRAPVSFMEGMKNTSHEEQKKEMDSWMKWAKKCGKGLVSMGTPLVNRQRLTKSGSSSSNSKVAGYSILQAKNMGEAKKMLKNHPHLAWKKNCDIEVYESIEMHR